MKLFRRKKQSLRFRGLLAALAVCVLFSLVVLTAGETNSAKAEPTVSPAKPAAPEVEFLAQPVHESIGRDEPVAVYLFISNNSALKLEKLKLSIPDSICEIVSPASFPETLSPFESANVETIVKMRGNAAFEPHKIPFILQYAWEFGEGKQAVSAKSATVGLNVTRSFEEEAKGFPGGTAAFLYLLLPIVPAILGFQFFENLRAGQGIQAPAFKTEYIVPAFFIAILLNFLMILAFSQNSGLNFSDPKVFLGVLLVSFLTGSLLPGSRWLWGLFEKRLWGFNSKDSLETYLKKALLASGNPPEFKRVTGTVGSEQWTGVLLRQPDGKTVALGARLQVSPVGTSGETAYEEIRENLENKIFRGKVLIDKARLVEMVKSGKLKLDYEERIRRGNETVDCPVVIDEVSDFKQSGNGTAVELIEPSS